MKESSLIVNLKNLLDESLKSLGIQLFFDPNIQHNKRIEHGEFSSNVAMKMAKEMHEKPLELAKRIVDSMPPSPWLDKTAVAGPGFINFYLSQSAYRSILKQVLLQKEHYGQHNIGQQKRVLIEFVSANPTGPLHVGHGRGAIFGDVLAKLLMHMGYEVETEYYLNDVGRQMRILATSVWLRFLETKGMAIAFPKKAYQGHYIGVVAQTLAFDAPTINQEQLTCFQSKLDHDDEQQMEQWITLCAETLGPDFETIQETALQHIFKLIQNDLKDCGIQFNHFFSEKKMLSAYPGKKLLETIKSCGKTYEKDEALWLETGDFEEKDRVLFRRNGQPTYFVSDIVYHLDKFNRNYHTIINIWGGDHHGYIPRLQSAMHSFKKDISKLEVILIQFVSLLKNKTNISMSTRSGEFVTLKQLCSMVEEDALRFFYIRQDIDQSMVFDIDLAKTKDKQNPIFYIQYACARITRLFEKVKYSSTETTQTATFNNQEKKLITNIMQLEKVMRDAALTRQPHRIAQHLEEIASDFHKFYNDCHIVSAGELKQQRLEICSATMIVLHNSLKILGIKPRKSM